jgi:archaellin
MRAVIIALVLASLIFAGCVGPDTATLSVNSSPEGSGVYIDNEYRGTTPVTVSGIPSGSHTLELRHEGFQKEYRQLDLKSGSFERLLLPLQPVPTPRPTTIGVIATISQAPALTPVASPTASVPVKSPVTAASPDVTLTGQVYALGDVTGEDKFFRGIRFDIGLKPGTGPVEMDKAVITIISSTNLSQLSYSDSKKTGAWSITEITGASDGNTILSQNEVFEITALPQFVILPGEKISVEVKPRTGASLAFLETMPYSVEPVTRIG